VAAPRGVTSTVLCRCSTVMSDTIGSTDRVPVPHS